VVKDSFCFVLASIWVVCTTEQIAITGAKIDIYDVNIEATAQEASVIEFIR
jgi:hypothetical protein